jgi:hypothetical protein
MRTSDLVLTLIIILIFIGLYVFNILAIGIQNIKDNWPKYRCNPVVMPFASSFGQDPMSNFTYCIQNMQKSYMSYLLQPVNYSINLVGNMGNRLTKDLNFARTFISNIRGFITDIIQSVFGVFFNLIIEIQRIIIGFKDMIGKTIGIMVTLMYMIDGTVKTMKSGWNGAPGKMIRIAGRCFDVNTSIALESGKVVKMKNININDVLSDGSSVIATMKISNTDEFGNFISPLYEIYSEDLKENIKVTGEHLVQVKSGNFVPVADSKLGKELDNNQKSFCCLITDTHRIKIGEHIFWDWEDGHDMNNLDKFK